MTIVWLPMTIVLPGAGRAHDQQKNGDGSGKEAERLLGQVTSLEALAERVGLSETSHITFFRGETASRSPTP